MSISKVVSFINSKGEKVEISPVEGEPYTYKVLIDNRPIDWLGLIEQTIAEKGKK